MDNNLEQAKYGKDKDFKKMWKEGRAAEKELKIKEKERVQETKLKELEKKREKIYAKKERQLHYQKTKAEIRQMRAETGMIGKMKRMQQRVKEQQRKVSQRKGLAWGEEPSVKRKYKPKPKVPKVSKPIIGDGNDFITIDGRMYKLVPKKRKAETVVIKGQTYKYLGDVDKPKKKLKKKKKKDEWML